MVTRTQNPQRTEEMEVFYDGDCPVCSREVAFLIRRKQLGDIRFTNILEMDTAQGARVGLSQDQLMERIHARLSDGSVIEGVEVFRRLYERLGWCWLVAPTRWPILRTLCDLAYSLFARNRRRWTRWFTHAGSVVDR